MRTLISCLALALTAGPTFADGPAKGVVELFTSQGCSSCPPADAAFAKFAGRGDMVALSWHVDYWDYLGWKDTFSSPAATARQERYASHIGGGSYTPEFVINGAQGSSHSSIVASGGLPVSVSVAGGKVSVGAGSGSANVVLVNYRSAATVPIARGENAGREITYYNVVSGLSNLGAWNGLPMTLEAIAGGSCAVILQRPGQGEIIGAANC